MSAPAADGFEPGRAGAGGRPLGTPHWGRRAIFLTAGAYAAALLVSLVLVLMGRGVIGSSGTAPGSATQATLLSAGLFGLLLTLTLSPIAVIIAIRLATSASGASTASLERRLADLHDAVRVLSEQAALSDDARRVLNRATEREMLGRAIEQDILQKDWDAALVLCDELANRFGYRTEAETFRARVQRLRAGGDDAAVREGLALTDGMLLQRRWADAAAEAAKLARLYPADPRVASLPDRVRAAKADYTEDVRARFLTAAAALAGGGQAQASSPDEALALLRELDGLLTPAEAEPLRDQARVVVAAARDALGEQFRAALEDEDWADAATIGRRITTEFPNTRMAAEVRAMLDGILARANA